MKTTLIIPALNEAEVIGTVLSRVPPNLLDEVLVVDNGSTDGTAEAAARAGARVITEIRRGYGSACWAGVGALRPTVEIASCALHHGDEGASRFFRFERRRTPR